MAKKPVLIPYAPDGSIPWKQPWSYDTWNEVTEDYNLHPGYAWKAPKPFTARLAFHSIKTVRSGATVRMRNEDTGAIYPMKLDHFTGLVGFMKYGVLPVMDWEPYKVGNNYNIRRVTGD